MWKQQIQGKGKQMVDVVGGGSVIGLKAELIKKQEEYVKEKNSSLIVSGSLPEVITTGKKYQVNDGN